MKTKRIVSFAMFGCFALALLVSVNAYGADEKGAKDVQKKQFQWKNIKESKGTIKPNIPAQYEDLVKNFDAYWNARKAKKYEVAYELEWSGLKSITSFDEYRKQFEGSSSSEAKIVSVRAIEVKPLNDKKDKEVVVEGFMGYRASIVDSVRPFQDRWIREENGWKHIPEKREVRTPETVNIDIKKQ